MLSSDRPTGSTLRVLALCAVCATCFAPYLVGAIMSPTFLAAAAFWAYGMTELVRRGADFRQRAVWVSAPVAIGCFAYGLSALPTPFLLAHVGYLPLVLNQYGVLLPIAAMAGVIAVGDERIRDFSVLFRIFAILSAIAAVIERTRGRAFFPGNVVSTDFSSQSLALATTDSGSLRGIVASAHPLVLGTLLAAAVAMVLVGTLRFRTWIEVALLLAGIWATDSTGPLAVAVALVGARLVLPRLRRAGMALTLRRARFLYAVLILAFGAAAIWWWKPIVDTGSSVSESTQYRFALFALIPGFLVEHPFGFGLGPLPAGQVLVDRTGRVLDASVSVDSELVLSVLQLGVLGAAIYLLVSWSVVRVLITRAIDPVLSVPTFALGVMGLVVAIHVWPSIGGMWAFLVGAVLWAAVRSRRVRARTANPSGFDRLQSAHAV